MQFHERKIRIKVVFGYSLLALFAIFSVFYIYQTVFLVVADSDKKIQEIQQKSLSVSKVLSTFYELENSSVPLYQYPDKKSIAAYKAAMRHLDTNLAILRTETNSSKQITLLEEIQNLIQQKNKNIGKLFAVYNSVENEVLLRQIVSDIIAESPTSYTRDVIVLNNTNESTIYKEVTKPSLWERVFGRKKSTEIDIIQDTTNFSTTDTIKTSYTSPDSLSIVLSKFQDKLKTQQNTKAQKIRASLDRLIATDQKIFTQVSLLMNELGEEVMESSIKELGAKEENLQKSLRNISWVAIVSVLLICGFIVVIFRDINRSKAYKRELEKARSHAEQLMQSRQELLFSISHDIKAPLCSITGYLDLMDASTDSKAKQYAKFMKISTSYISNLIGNLLAYAHLESGKANLNLQVFDINVFFQDIKDTFLPLAQSKNINLQIQSSTEILSGSQYVQTDLVRVQQVVMNLLSNALKFTDKGEVFVEYTLEKDNNLLIIKVKDSGCGIPPEKQQAIFEQFSRIETSNSPCKEGNGLGLSVVKGIIQLLGGSIHLDSQVELGSCFTIAIPVDFMNETESITLSSFKENVTLSLLFIDDDPLQLRMIKEMLSFTNHIVYTAQNKDEAEKIWSTTYLDKIFTDLQMPSFSGYDLLQIIQSSEIPNLRNIPVYALSASDHIHQAEVKKLGFQDFLKKPFSLAQILYFLKMPHSPTNEAWHGHLDKENSSRPDVSKGPTRLSDCSSTKTPSPKTRMIELMGGDVHAAQLILDAFYQESRKNTKDLEDLFVERKYGEIKQICHKMLPMFLQLGIDPLGSLLADIDHTELKDMENGEKDSEIQQIINSSKAIC